MDKKKEKTQVIHRTRDGCLTCRRRKKKCDSTGFPCQACIRLGLNCERNALIIWEDDKRRDGIRRRGPPKKQHESFPKSPPDFSSDTSLVNPGQAVFEVVKSHHLPPPNPLVRGLSQYLHMLQGTELVLLENYIHRFSRTYPTFSAPANPFLSIFLPLAMEDKDIMNSLLVLSSAQTSHQQQPALEREMLSLRQRALRGTRKLLQGNDNVSIDSWTGSVSKISTSSLDNLPRSTILALLTIAVMFLLYDKLVGETTWKAHLDFIGQLCDHYSNHFLSPRDTEETFCFLHNLYLYNDLVRATTLQTATSSNFYLLDQASKNAKSRYHFPNLIARISANDQTVTESDISAWDGNMGWLPSFALSDAVFESHTTELHPHAAERLAMRQLYEKAAIIYLHQRQHSEKSETSLLAAQAVHLTTTIPADSPFENALIWPLGIVARELQSSQTFERTTVLNRLEKLEQRFSMQCFRRVREWLKAEWAGKDFGVFKQNHTHQDDAEMILMG